MPNSPPNNPAVPITLAAFIAGCAQRLKTAGIEDADIDTRLLIAHGLKLDRAQLLSQSERILSEREQRLLTVLIECRARHEPVSRIKGRREFWGLSFDLNEATLDPRPDSETLIETALKTDDRNRPLRILDLGTGTGCLLLALLHELPNATGIGIDIAPRAVEQAKLNAEQLNFQDRAQFKINDWLEGIDEKFDIIISNPPYIAAIDIPGLAPEVREHDPMRALDGGINGVDAYLHLIPQLTDRLNSGGVALLEIGPNQSAVVSGLFKQVGFKYIKTHRDLGGRDRCVSASIAWALHMV